MPKRCGDSHGAGLLEELWMRLHSGYITIAIKKSGALKAMQESQLLVNRWRTWGMNWGNVRKVTASWSPARRRRSWVFCSDVWFCLCLSRVSAGTLKKRACNIFLKYDQHMGTADPSVQYTTAAGHHNPAMWVSTLWLWWSRYGTISFFHLNPGGFPWLERWML